MMIFRKDKTNMYSRKPSKTPSKKLILVLGIVILGLVVGGVLYYKQRQNNRVPVTETPGSDTPLTRDGGTDGSDKTPQQFEDSEITTSPSLDGIINYKSVSNGVLIIRATINQSINTGTCALTLTRSSDKKQVSKSAEIVPNPSSATCKGFDIPVSELGSGKWNIVIEVTDGDKTGTISGDITI